MWCVDASAQVSGRKAASTAVVLGSQFAVILFKVVSYSVLPLQRHLPNIYNYRILCQHLSGDHKQDDFPNNNTFLVSLRMESSDDVFSNTRMRTKNTSSLRQFRWHPPIPEWSPASKRRQKVTRCGREASQSFPGREMLGAAGRITCGQVEECFVQSSS
ncbi:hypothetical protein MAP00_002841 [Monascus purpureus]|nr:hypothetical protein MAP00_002841 [Monascus purpureus]